MSLPRYAQLSGVPDDAAGKVWTEDHGGTVWDIADGLPTALWGPLSYDEAEDHLFLFELGVAPDLPAPSVTLPAIETSAEPTEGSSDDSSALETNEADPDQTIRLDAQHDDIRSQLLIELSETVATVAAFLGPTMGLELFHHTERILDDLTDRLSSMDPDDVEEATDIIRRALWSRCDPPMDWWRSPVGRVCAGTFGRQGPPISVNDAATVLGVSRTWVYSLLNDGVLVMAEGRRKGVDRASLMGELKRGARTRGTRRVKS